MFSFSSIARTCHQIPETCNQTSTLSARYRARLVLRDSRESAHFRSARKNHDHYSRSADFICDFSYRYETEERADITVIFVRAWHKARRAPRPCTCVCMYMRKPTRIMKFRYRKTILSCMPGQILRSYAPMKATHRTTVIAANCTFLVCHYEILRFASTASASDSVLRRAFLRRGIRRYARGRC